MTKAVTLAELADQNVLTATDNKVGIATTNPQSTLQVGTGITMNGNTGVITAQAYHGDGSNLTGIDATSIKDSNGTVRVQATTTGADVTGNLNVSGVLTYEDVTNIDAVGIVTANSGIEVAGIVTAKPGAAVTYYGDGSNLTGIDATALKDSDSTVRVQANTSGVVVTGVLTATSFSGIDASSLSDSNSATRVQATTSGAVVTGVLTATSFSGDGSALTFAPKVVAFDPAALSTGVAANTNITITFDQNIQFAGTGTIELRSTSTSGTLIESFAITSGTPASGLSISGTQLIINPTSNLSDNTVVYVILPNQGIQATSGGLYYAGSSNYNFRTVAQSFNATGGDQEFTIPNIAGDPSPSPTGYYKYHIFINPGTLVADSPSNNATNFTSMLVGGGGGAPYSASGDSSGGAGAGGVLRHTGPSLNFPSGTWNVEIGNGGLGGTPSPVHGTNGDNSAIIIAGVASVTAYGGGLSGRYPSPVDGSPGGSGGGAGGSDNTNVVPGTGDVGGGISGQGNPGGTHFRSAATQGVSCRTSGGGGGSGSAGGNASGTTSNSAPYAFSSGNGGNAAPNTEFTSALAPRVAQIPTGTWTIIGTSGLYGGGGGGGISQMSQPGDLTAGTGGSGGGGDGGGGDNAGGAGQPGVDYTGGGGGGSGQTSNGGNGGKGVAMFRYAVPGS